MILLPTYVSNLRPAGQMLPAKAQKLKKFLIALEKKSMLLSFQLNHFFIVLLYFIFMTVPSWGGGGLVCVTMVVLLIQHTS